MHKMDFTAVVTCIKEAVLEMGRLLCPIHDVFYHAFFYVHFLFHAFLLYQRMYGGYVVDTYLYYLSS